MSNTSYNETDREIEYKNYEDGKHPRPRNYESGDRTIQVQFTSLLLVEFKKIETSIKDNYIGRIYVKKA